MSGIDLLLTHTARELSGGHVREVCIACFNRGGDPRARGKEGEVAVSAGTTINCSAEPLSKKSRVRALLGGWRIRDERRFLLKVNELGKRCDVAIWFGEALDPLTLRIPGAIPCAVVNHVNDSLGLYNRRRARGIVRILRERVARGYETRMLRAGYDATIYASPVDGEYARGLLREAERHQIVVLPNGVDADHFRPRDSSAVTAAGGRVLFSGKMSYGPNVEAACALVRDVLPAMKGVRSLTLAGKAPAMEILRLAGLDPRVTVTGQVDDLTPFYQEADVFVAPMQSGAGIQNKVLEALACGVPVVTTPMCAAAFGAPPPGVLVGSTVGEIASLASGLIADTGRREQLGREAREYILRFSTWGMRGERLAGLLEEVMRKRRLRRPV